MNPPTLEPGYVLIKTQADREFYAPKRATDECLMCDGRWKILGSTDIIKPFIESCIYRRKIPASDGEALCVCGHTQLLHGYYSERCYVCNCTQFRKAGDEKCDTKTIPLSVMGQVSSQAAEVTKAAPVSHAAMLASGDLIAEQGKMIDELQKELGKLKSQPPAHWLPRTKDSKCEPPFWLGAKTGVTLIKEFRLSECDGVWPYYMPITVPEPPLPQKETADEASAKYSTRMYLTLSNVRQLSAREDFLAGVAWQKGQGGK